MIVRRERTKQLDDAGVGRKIREIWDTEGSRLPQPVLFENVRHAGAADDWLPRICDAAGIETVEYIGGNSPRTKVRDSVYTSTEYPQRETLSLHQELSYERHAPEVLVFVCETPPSSGGETPVCDAGELLAELPYDVIAPFIERGVRYHQLLSSDPRRPGVTWMEQFQTSSRVECEHYLNQRDVSYGWEVDGSLRIVRDREAIRRHPVTELPLWFNQADQWDIRMSMNERQLAVFDRMFGLDAAPHSVSFADGGEIDIAHLRLIKETGLRISTKEKWASGDVLVIDNRQHMHGRMPFVGDRKILVSMGDLGGTI